MQVHVSREHGSLIKGCIYRILTKIILEFVIGLEQLLSKVSEKCLDNHNLQVQYERSRYPYDLFHEDGRMLHEKM